ncbi:MaoC family dehydratase [Amycolatopsis sp. NPDC059657]|uniref:MaoC family dehydratase n=1 Tax=Amycolatopsis sp. NPDC059657 TaxID=3346899 RepID=UPI00366C829A
MAGLTEVADWFAEREGTQLGYSDWHEVTQDDVRKFADVTRDWQRIHLDTAAAAAGPYRVPVAHGFYVLALIPYLTSELLDLSWTTLGLNYRLDRIRFPAPTPVGARVRATAKIGASKVRPRGFLELVLAVTIEAEGGDRPVCTADHARLYQVAPDAGLPGAAAAGLPRLDPPPAGTEAVA